MLDPTGNPDNMDAHRPPLQWHGQGAPRPSQRPTARQRHRGSHEDNEDKNGAARAQPATARTDQDRPRYAPAP